MISILIGVIVDEADGGDSMYPKKFDRKCTDRTHLVPISRNRGETPQLPMPPKVAWPSAHDQDSQLFKSCNPYQSSISPTDAVKDPIPPKRIPLTGHGDVQPSLALSDLRGDTIKDTRFTDGGQLYPNKPCKELSLDVEDLDIPWSDLVLKERIGAGIYMYSPSPPCRTFMNAKMNVILVCRGYFPV